MKASCPNCGETVEFDDQEHYKLVTCPGCEEEFQALGKGTVVSAMNFLDLIEKRHRARETDAGGDEGGDEGGGEGGGEGGDTGEAEED